MIATSHNEQQGASDRGVGATPVVGCDRSSSIALNHEQDWSASCRAGLALCTQHTLGGDRGPVISHSHLPGATLHSTRQRRSALPSMERGATLNGVFQ